MINNNNDHHHHQLDQPAINSNTPIIPNCLFLYPHLITCPISITSRAVLTPCMFDCVNGMALNTDKSEAILLGTRQRAHSYSSLATVNVASSQIPLADHIKILGVTLDKKLIHE